MQANRLFPLARDMMYVLMFCTLCNSCSHHRRTYQPHFLLRAIVLDIRNPPDCMPTYMNIASDVWRARRTFWCSSAAAREFLSICFVCLSGHAFQGFSPRQPAPCSSALVLRPCVSRHRSGAAQGPVFATAFDGRSAARKGPRTPRRAATSEAHARNMSSALFRTPSSFAYRLTSLHGKTPEAAS